MISVVVIDGGTMTLGFSFSFSVESILSAFDPPAFQCQICEAPFALLSHYNGYSCSSPFEQLTDRDINLTNQWAEVRLHEELQKISGLTVVQHPIQDDVPDIDRRQ